MNKLVRILLVGFLLIGIFSTSVFAMWPFSQPKLEGKAPNFNLRSTKGLYVSLDEFKRKKPVIVFFWTTWCTYCARELREISGEYDKIKESNAALLAINSGESEQKVKRYINRHSISIQVLLDSTGEVSQEYRVIGVPTYVFIDSSGMIIDVLHQLPENYLEKLIK